jgi:hypothetical protein
MKLHKKIHGRERLRLAMQGAASYLGQAEKICCRYAKAAQQAGQGIEHSKQGLWVRGRLSSKGVIHALVSSRRAVFSGDFRFSVLPPV